MKKELFMQIVRGQAKQTLSPEEESMFGSIGQAVEQAFTESGVERQKAIDKLANQLGTLDEGQTVAGIIRGMAEKIDQLETRANRGFSDKDKKSLRAVLEANKDVIRNSRRKDAPAWEVEFTAKRAASALMTTSTLLTGALAINNPNMLDDMDITFIQYPKNFILDAITSRQVSKVPATRRWKEQITAGTGAVASTAEGVEKPLVDYKFEYKYAYRVKYPGRIEMTEEDEIDMEQLTIDILNMFERDVIKAWQDGVLAAIVAYAPSYTTTGLNGTIVKPTVYSVIGAGKLHVQVNNYEPDVVILNPADAAEAMYLQDNNGNQQFIPSDLMFGGLQPFISNKVAAGTVIVGTKAMIDEQHGNFIIRRGTYGTQFIENEFTVVGEVFSNLKLPTASQYSWCKLDVATVKAALLKPTGN